MSVFISQVLATMFGMLLFFSLVVLLRGPVRWASWNVGEWLSERMWDWREMRRR